MPRKQPPTGPERILNVRQSQLSIARFYGGCTYNGVHYVYDPTNDSLIRHDVLKREQQATRQATAAKRKAAKAQRERQPQLPLEQP